MQAEGFQDPAEFEKFTNFSLKDLTNPLSLKDMELAVERLIQAYNQNEKICLYADFDMDGTPGLALLIRGLQLCGFENLLSFQPNRFDDGYGVHREIVEEFINNHGISLFVTVDVGITDIEAVARAKELGVDFIITDHHQPKSELPPAVAIVNPNQEDCHSGLGHLCGTGVAFYLILALRKSMHDAGLLAKNFDPKELLDCFAIGTLSDMVPLVRENRSLTQHGLLQLQRTRRIGLRALMDELKLSEKRLTSADVSIQLAPKLNALGRMDSEVQALDLFLAGEEQQALLYVQKTLEAQKQRTETQRQGEVEMLARLSQDPDCEHFAFAYSENFYKGVVGLLATKASGEFQVPSFVGALIDQQIVGSARALPGQNLLEALEFASTNLVQFGGHKQAAGFVLKLDQVEGFRQDLREFYRQAPEPLRQVHYHCRAEIGELDLDFKNWLRRLEPYGVGFSPPIFRLDHVFLSQVRVLKEKHIKCQFKDISGQSLEALWFFADNIEEIKQMSSQRVCALVQPSINEYMGREKLQLLIKDLKLEY